MSTVPLILYVNCFFDPVYQLLLWSRMSTVPLILHVDFLSGPLHLLFLWFSVQCSLVLCTCCCSDSMSNVPLILCVNRSSHPDCQLFLWSFVSAVPLILYVNCSSNPVCQLFVWSSVPVVALILYTMFFWSCVLAFPLILYSQWFSNPAYLMLLRSCVQCSPGPVCQLFFDPVRQLFVSSFVPVVALILCPMFFWSRVPASPLIWYFQGFSSPAHLLLLRCCVHCYSGPMFPLFRWFCMVIDRSAGPVWPKVPWSSVCKRLLVLWTCLSSDPVCPLFFVSVCPLFVWSCVPKGSLVLRTICSSDPVYPLFLFS